MSKGTIYTFYSFKGGVGRSMALANLAALFYRRGYTTLVVDWDLEAPGIERYFKERFDFDYVDALNHPGLSCMIGKFIKNVTTYDPAIQADSTNRSDTLPYPDLQRYIYEIDERNGTKLSMIHAGRRSPGEGRQKYIDFVHTFDWIRFYKELGGNYYMEWLRKQLKSMADIILIDSRTGVTEMGGVATQHLADVVAIFCGSNYENTENSALMAKTFMSPEVRNIRYGRQLEVVVVPSRIDDADSLGYQRFIERFHATFSGIPLRQFSDGYKPEELLIPYLPALSYHEELVVEKILVEKTDDRESHNVPLEDYDRSAHRLVEAYLRIADYLKSLAQWFEPGETVPFSVLSVGVAGYADFSKDYPEREVHSAIESFGQLVNEFASQYDGVRWRKREDGGVWAFGGKRRCQRVVMTGIRLIHDLALFNLDEKRSQSSIPLKIRVAVGDGDVTYREPVSEIQGLVIDDVIQLQSERTRAGELNITEEVLGQLDERLQQAFPLPNVYRETNIYPYLGLLQQQRTESDVNDYIDGIERKIDELLLVCKENPITEMKDEQISSLHADIRRLYDDFDHFRGWFSRDQGLKQGYIQKHGVLRKVGELRRHECRLWNETKDWLSSSSSSDGVEPEVILLLESLKAGHAEEKFELIRLENRLMSIVKRLNESELEPKLLESIHAFVDAGDLDRITAFIAMAQRDWEQLVFFVASQGTESLAAKLAERMWSLVDLVLAEDTVCRKRWDKSGSPPALFERLLARPGMVARFHVLDHFLESAQLSDQAFKIRFEKADIQSSEEDVFVLWRSLVVAHTNTSIRYTAAKEAPLRALWQLVAYPRTPLDSLWMIAQRLEEAEPMAAEPNSEGAEEGGGDDLKKIFFDCVKSRIFRDLDSIQDSADFLAIGHILNLLCEFSFFFREARYFAYLDELLNLFEKAAVRFEGITVPLLDRLARFKEKAADAAISEASVPEAEIDKLPPLIQRFLARDGCYVEKFACHADYRIAKETIPYIDEKAAERIKTYSSRMKIRVNRDVAAHIKKEKEGRRLRFVSPEQRRIRRIFEEYYGRM